VVKTQAWEQEHNTAFAYDGVALLAMLDEYRIQRQEKEEEKRRMRVFLYAIPSSCMMFGFVMISPSTILNLSICHSRIRRR
jgi:hypothetical protein